MIFNIHHRTRYDYSQSVRLSPQQLRFYPRVDGSQQVLAYNLNVSPASDGQNDYLDMEGNRVTQVWFDSDLQFFEITVDMQVNTLRKHPFDFILSPESMRLPIDHEQDAICARGYLVRSQVDDAVTVFAAQISLSVNRDTLQFLDKLSQQMHADFRQVHRHSGEPHSPARTLKSRTGACRDLAVLFVDCCRAEGIAARFASGYQRGNLRSDDRDLHAWPEVYLPGAGWRGYDPTLGCAVADSHVTIAAASRPRDTLPVSGGFIGTGANSALDFSVQIQILNQ